MVTKRLSVDAARVNWYDGQQVTFDEVDAEQARNLAIDAANVGNFMGSGVVRFNPVPVVIFDSGSLNDFQQNLFDGYSFDGTNILNATPTLSDTVEGVQLAVTLSDVSLSGSAKTKVAIFGISFGDELIHDDLVFNENGTQITRGRYKEIRGILFNDFAGNLRGSDRLALDDDYNFVGSCTIREAESLETSFDHVLEAQTAQPNQFFNNFPPAGFGETPTEMLQNAIGLDRSLSELNIGLGSLTTRELAAGDVSTRYGQKFLATGTNIQKISILLAVQEDQSALPMDAYNWTGSIVLTLHALQTEVDCPVAITPDNAVDFDPDPTVLAQLSLDVDNLRNQGVVLDGTSRVVDFVLTGTSLADPSRSPIEEGRYYVFTIGRSGDTSVGTLLLEEAPHRTSSSGYMVVFDGSQWIEVRESDLWFSIEGDYAKVSNGLAYEDGVGVEVPKIKQNSSNTEVPYVEGLLSLTTTSRDAYNYLLLEPDSEFSEPEQDQRTGNQVFSRVAPIPSFSMLTDSQLTTLRVTNPAPVLTARAYDHNPRGNPSTITASATLPGVAEDVVFHIINPNADVRTHGLVNSILVPDSSASYQYRIIEANLITDSYGDINGDGLIDAQDLALINSWIADSYDFDLSTAAGQQQIIDGYATLDQVLRADLNGDGKVDASDAAILTNYLNKSVSTFPVGSSYSRMELKVEAILDPKNNPADIAQDNDDFQTAPFTGTTWRINYVASWIPDNIVIEDVRRDMPTTFTTESTDELPGGRNDFYVPGNLLIVGQQLNPDGTSYSVDFEVNHLTLNIPIIDSYGNPTFLDGYKGLLLFDNFVAESSSGKTATGFDAMKYHDGTYVQADDFSASKVKIVPAIQSTANQYPITMGGDIDDVVGLYYDPSTSLLTLYINNLYDDGYGNALPPRSMKVSVVVYLKKAGFANDTASVSEAEMRELLNI